MGLEFGLRVSAGSGTMNLNPLSALGARPQEDRSAYLARLARSVQGWFRVQGFAVKEFMGIWVRMWGLRVRDTVRTHGSKHRSNP